MMNGIKHFLSSLRNIIHPVTRLSSETLFYHAAVFLATFFISFNFYLVGEGGCRTKNSFCPMAGIHALHGIAAIFL